MKKFLPFLMILSLMLSLTACGTAQSGSEPESTAQSPEESSAQAAPETPEQDNSWQFDSPENHQMDPEVFEALHQALPGSGIHTMVTVKDGSSSTSTMGTATMRTVFLSCTRPPNPLPGR